MQEDIQMPTGIDLSVSFWVCRCTYTRGRFPKSLNFITPLTCEVILSWKYFLVGLCRLIPLYVKEWRTCKKFWNTTGGVRPNQWMQMPSLQQPRVPLWLQMPRMCGTNPQDLVCFPPHLPSALCSSPHLPCLPCCISVSTVLDFVSSHLTFMFLHSCHPWPSFH